VHNGDPVTPPHQLPEQLVGPEQLLVLAQPEHPPVNEVPQQSQYLKVSPLEVSFEQVQQQLQFEPLVVPEGHPFVIVHPEQLENFAQSVPLWKPHLTPLAVHSPPSCLHVASSSPIALDETSDVTKDAPTIPARP